MEPQISLLFKPRISSSLHYITFPSLYHFPTSSCIVSLQNIKTKHFPFSSNLSHHILTSTDRFSFVVLSFRSTKYYNVKILFSSVLTHFIISSVNLHCTIHSLLHRLSPLLNVQSKKNSCSSSFLGITISLFILYCRIPQLLYRYILFSPKSSVYYHEQRSSVVRWFPSVCALLKRDSPVISIQRERGNTLASTSYIHKRSSTIYLST